MTEAAATLERPEDAGPPPSGIVARWLLELKLADKEEEAWRKEAKRVYEVYRNEKDDQGVITRSKSTAFNILWANTEILAPAIYNSTPKPDVRRRFRDADPLGKAVADVLRRGLEYEVDECELDDEAQLALMDYLLPGRAVIRVRYTASVNDTVVSDQKVYPEVVHWDDFRRGPGKVWREVPWIAFRHRMTREEGEQAFGDKWARVTLEDVDIEGTDKDSPALDSFKRGEVWEVWDKTKREVVWISTSYKDEPLRVDADPLRLKGFYCIPRPLYSMETPNSLVPVPEYSLYEKQAEELEKISRRIAKLIDACRVRGVYNSLIGELRKLLETDSGDNDMVAAENVAALLDSGGLEKHIWLMPIETIAKVLLQLYEQREQIKAVIYEITGISDILRGASNAAETARAQEIKSQFGTMRLQKRQARVAKFFRDVIRLMAEIIAEHYTTESLQAMTGVELPTEQQKQALQAQAQALSAQQQPIPPELQQALMSPSWEDVIGVLQSDEMRGYCVDIETDSTVQQQVVQEQRDITELLTGIVNFLTGVAPAVQAGAMPVDTAKTLLLAAVRRFRLGNEVEDALSKLEAPKGQPPEVAQMQEQMQQEQQAMAGERQQMEGQKQQMAEQMQAKSMQLAEREHALTMKEMQADYERQLMDRDKREYETARKFDERLSQMQADSQSADQVQAQAGVQKAEQTVQQLMQAMESFGKQVSEAVSALSEQMAQQGEATSQAVQQIQASIESIAAFQRSPKRVVRGQDGSISVQDARTVQ